jgi:hypothetical protein
VTVNRTLLAVAGAVAGLFLSACSVHPGVAAVVGDDTITDSHVDEVATALCSAQSGAGASGQQDLASRAARQGALDVLINADLSRQYGAAKGAQANQGQVASALAANQKNIAALPAEHRAVFSKTLRDYAEGQLMLIDIGRRELTAQGKQGISDQQAVSEGTKLRNQWAAKHLRISVDPRYGEFSKGALLAKSGSLSVAQSARAADGDSPDPSAGWVASLPAAQKCSS